MNREHGHTEPANNCKITAHIYHGVKFGKVELDYSVPDFDEPTRFYLVDFNKWYGGGGLYMTTIDKPDLTGINKNYIYTGVPVREFMEIATGPENRIPMVVQNRVNEKALEEL